MDYPFKITNGASRFFIIFTMVFFLVFTGCTPEQPVKPVEDSQESINLSADSMTELEALFVQHTDRELSLMKKGRQIVRVPAGSEDALAAAIAAVGKEGLIIVESGLHHESQSIMITDEVRIVGENDAVIEFDTQPWPPAPRVEADFHIKNAANVVLWNLELRPAGNIGGTAVLVEGGKNAIIGRNTILEHQIGVMVENAYRSKIYGNKIVATKGWQTGEAAFVLGAVIVNGQKAELEHNDISNAINGIWACDLKGKAKNNYLHNNLIGLLLCKVPADRIVLPDGRLTGAAFPATKWEAENNNSVSNIMTGYMVIDGANNNRLTNNNASSNGTYDIELTGDTSRFGWLAPRSHHNTVVAGSYQNLIIKNCGDDNVVIGGQLVDNAQDPCF